MTTKLTAGRLEVLSRDAFILSAARIEVLVQNAEAEDSCAEKPGQHFILPDPLLKGAENVFSASSESGVYPGAVAATSGNLGRLLPVQTGRLTTLAEDNTYLLSDAGGVDGGEFVWRNTGDATDTYYGADDPQRFQGQHHPEVMGGVSVDDAAGNNSAVVYSSLFNRVVILSAPKSGGSVGTVTVGYRDVDDDRYNEFSTTTLVLNRAYPSGAGTSHNLTAIELPDGRLLLVVRVAVASGHDFDMYQSGDGGLTWALSARSVITRSTGETSLETHELQCQVRLARSGEHLRLAWVEGSAPANIKSAYSSDRGATWSLTTDAIPVHEIVGVTDDDSPFDIESTDDAGGFVIVYLTDTLTDNLTWWFARGSAAFAVLAAGSTITATGDVFQVVLQRTPSWLYCWVLFSDLAGGKVDGWMFYRVEQDNTRSLPSVWQVASPISAIEGMEYLPGRVQSAWTGDGVVFWGSSRDVGATVADQTRGQLWYWGGWSQRSMGRYEPSHVFVSGDSPVWEIHWHCGLGFPSEPNGSTWTETIVGTGLKVSTRASLVCAGLAAADVIKYTIIDGTGVWASKGAFAWRMRLDIGDSTVTADDVAVRIEGYDGSTASVDMTIRHGPAGLRVVDNENAAATLADLAIVLDAVDVFTEVRFWMATVGSTVNAQLSAYDYSTGLWVETAIFNPTRQTGAPVTTSTLQFGHLGQTQVTAMGSLWREMQITGQHTGQQGGPFDSATWPGMINPADLFGWQTASGMPTRIEHGLSVVWSGSGGVRGDSFSGPVEHQHPVESIAVASPQIDWRSIDTSGTSTLILDSDSVDGIDLWEHDAVAIFGANTRTVTIDYDESTSFASPTASNVIDCTAFGGEQYVVESATGTVIRASVDSIGAPITRYVQGECAGLYIRMIDGSAIDKTFKVTAHRTLENLHCGDEASSLSSQGVVAGDKFVYFRPQGSLSYSVPIGGAAQIPLRYMRIRFTDLDTAEGDHRLGSIVVGRRIPITVPMDWAYTDNQQANVTNYRTRGAVAWSFVEGPKQRTIVGRLVGDAGRFRDELRYLLGQVDFEAKPVALVLDDERLSTVMLGRVRSGSQHDNAAWYRDSDGVLRTAGDQSITFEEEG